jgi:hypothetical protein
MAASPLAGERPAFSRAAPWAAKSSGKNASMTWPKMIGSETFIMVAFRCTESRTSSRLARSTCSARNASRAAARITVPSTTSPASTGTDSLSTVVLPSSATRRIVRVSSPSMTTDFSLSRKSSAPIVATFVLDSAVHSPMRCGFLRT